MYAILPMYEGGGARGKEHGDERAELYRKTNDQLQVASNQRMLRSWLTCCSKSSHRLQEYGLDTATRQVESRRGHRSVQGLHAQP